MNLLQLTEIIIKMRSYQAVFPCHVMKPDLLDLFNRIVQIISDEPILQNKRNEILRKKEIEDYKKGWKMRN